MQRRFWTPQFFTDGAWFHVSGYVSSQNCSAANPRKIKDTPPRGQKVGVWCAISLSRIIGPYILQWHYQLETLLWSDSVSFNWKFKWGRKQPRLLPTGRCSCTHSSCLHDATARCVRGQNSCKGDLAPTVAWLHTPWLSSVGSNERRSLQRQCSHSARTEGSHREFHQDRTVACLCKQVDACRCVWGPCVTFIVT
jgi:hypothetical protein